MTVNYVPEVREIESIAESGLNCIVTTSENHHYVIGNTVKFVIPQEFEMVEINDRQGTVIEKTDDTLTININISNFTPFLVPASFTTPAQVIPVGSVNFGFEVQGTIPTPIGPSGAFRNIIS